MMVILHPLSLFSLKTSCSDLLGEKKLTKVICPDKWKDGARNTTVGTSSTAGRKLGENKLLSKKRAYVFNAMMLLPAVKHTSSVLMTNISLFPIERQNSTRTLPQSVKLANPKYIRKGQCIAKVVLTNKDSVLCAEWQSSIPPSIRCQPSKGSTGYNNDTDIQEQL
ncbi:hypothetical protein BGZ80_005340 [Entomortierella chlamydospora]|uniref:Uncharacterized protein n=1 Tax=Entomortierella chlamydospora TaxID=101097 RepID=A0A9P6T2T3_9FUNG|nr:hypothetical protein BGZ80_005340 [Entomortierella chlamydospora]